MGSGTGKTVLILPLCLFFFFSALNLEGSIWSSPKDHDRNNQNSQPYFNAQKRCDTNHQNGLQVNAGEGEECSCSVDRIMGPFFLN